VSGFLDQARAELNERQFEAVKTTEGPVLVLAGAGSGKTRVLTYRIAHLVYDLRVPLSSILAMTFSNKAAREMQERVLGLLNLHQQLPWISTFHSVGARLLRRWGERLGYSSDFVIYDESDQMSVMKTVVQSMSIDDREASADQLHSRIGQWKNEGKTAQQVQDMRTSRFDDLAAQAYTLYEQELKRANALDFDDLLLQTYRLLKECPDVRDLLQNQWKFILVDEFQDTNELQYKLLLELLGPHKNICVVGDDDQSIYGWRGAKIDNILNFDQVFKNAAVIKLEENYRSSGNILKAADSVIQKNEFRHQKSLWTKKGQGERVHYSALMDDRAESAYVVNEIKRLIQRGESPEEMAVLYRMNSLSRGFEEECLRVRVPYRIIGGFRFYERKEIKDVLSYLRLVLNPSDMVSFRRAVVSPSRGVGKGTIEKIEELSRQTEKPIGQWIVEQASFPAVGKGKAGLLDFQVLLNKAFGMLRSQSSFVDLVVEILDSSKYIEGLKNEESPDSSERVENVKELLSAIQEFEENWAPAEGVQPEFPTRQKVADFLERVSLISDVDQLDSARSGRPVEKQPQVTFMSIHAAKGLEYKYCFVCGMEEGLFPMARAFDNYQQLEEERRLCYVAFTRAKERLTLTRALRRRTFGSFNTNLESRFLKDLPKDILDVSIDQSEDFYEVNHWQAKNRYASYARPQRKAYEEQSDTAFDFDFDQRTEDFSFKKGQRVNHPSFGEGLVQAVEMLGSDECLTIQFHRAGRKKVLAKFVK
jgi:DNA helicase-2/ATP-dependent DNA helicase PcrA